VIDLHCHVLPGIDDGPDTIEGSLELARAAAAAGTSTLVATPHVSSRYANTADSIATLHAEVSERLARERVPLELRCGAEIAISRIAELEPEELARLGLGGGPYLLLEPPYAPVVTGLDSIVRSVLDRGHRVVLAHPERCPGFHRHPAMLAELVNEGALTSLTAASLTGRFGETVRRFAMRMLEKGLAHNVTSDAHNHSRRPPSIVPELREAGAGELEQWLLVDVPTAILSGSAPPRRPPVSIQMRPRRRWPWGRRAA
jgi:protein-tyrosine phosphatase